MKAIVACLLVVGFLVAGSLLPTARAAPAVRERVVFFGIARRPLVPGFVDFEAGCRVTASYPEVAIVDRASATVPVDVSPGGCDVAVYVLGARVAAPLPFRTPLGRTSYRVPGVSGITLGLADVSVDLSARLRGEFSGDGVVLSASPGVLEWSEWGTAAATLSAHTGLRGSTLVATAPLRLSLSFGVGVSVYVLGVRVHSWEATAAVFDGTPRIEIPVSIDLAPSFPELTGAAADSAHALRVAWSECRDGDFAAYEVSVSGGEGPRVFLVRDRSRTSLTIDAAPSTDYAVQVTAVDGAGQRASSASMEVRTPEAPPHGPGAYTSIALVVAGSLAVAFGAVRARRAGRRSAPEGVGAADPAIPWEVEAGIRRSDRERAGLGVEETGVAPGHGATLGPGSAGVPGLTSK